VSPALATTFATISWRGRPTRIEHAWIAPALAPAQGDRGADAPLIVFLHEGLGSLSMWKDFPAALCEALGARGLVYSRPGYGRSTPRAPDEHWDADFMHRQAQEVLPALLQALGVHEPVWLFGHSDGGSIALLFAVARPAAVRGLVVLAPHIVVEEVSVANIQRAREAYLNGELKQRLARHHDDPDSAFWGWNRVWLDPAFRSWSIEATVASIAAPMLAIQGEDDEYGTLEQIRGIARQAPQTQLLVLPKCGHWPHRDAPQAVIDAARILLRSAETDRF
jgi:pimeloyl-ACP methyl ester carboxylesterase